MKRLLNKKGVTLVELIVVIAIIAILAALLIPALSNTSSHEQEARESARAFYSNVQQAMVQEKFNDTLKDITKEYTLIYAEVTTPDDTTIAYSKIYVDFADKSESGNIVFSSDMVKADNCIYEADTTSSNQQVPANKATPTNSDEKIKKALVGLSEFGSTINKLLYTSEHTGYYYAVVDSKYRVVSAYYSRYADYSKMNGNSFSDDHKVTVTNESGESKEYIAGAYPFTLLDTGDKLFTDPNI